MLSFFFIIIKDKDNIYIQIITRKHIKKIKWKIQSNSF